MNIENLNRARNAALALILAAGLSLPATGLAYAADDADEPDASDVKNKLDNLFVEEDEDVPAKSESVYVFAKADGSVKNTVVTSWLKNTEQAASLHDISSLTDIQNTEGKEGFEAKGESLVWDAQGNDIYYQGNTDKEAPVQLKVTYWLDGKEVAPGSLLGKSGHVKIRFDYVNNSTSTEYVDGAARTVYTPFVCMTGMILDNDVFKNIKATNAKAMNDGDRTLVGGVAFPGLQDDLGIDVDTLELPDYLEVEADATDFEMGTTATLVSSNLLDNLNTDEFDSNEIGDALNELSDATGKLVDGTSKLYDGVKQLDDGSHALADGAGELADKTSALPDSAQALADGSAQLAEGVGSAADGSAQLAAGNQQLVDGLNQLANGNDSTPGLAGAVAGVQALEQGVNGDGTEENPGLVNGLNSVSAGLEQVLNDPETGGLNGAIAALDGVEIPDTSEVAGKLGTMKQGAEGAQKAAQGAAMCIEGVEEALKKAGLPENDLNQLIENLENAKTYANTAADLDGQISGGIEGVSVPDTSELSVKVGALSAGLKQAVGGLEQIQDGVDTKLVPGGEQLSGGLAQLEGGLSTALGAIGDAKDSAAAQTAKKEQPTLLGGANDLNAALGQLSSGLNSAKTGANTLAGGLAQLNESVPALAGGISALQQGSAQLANGTDALEDGAKQLAEGMKTFDEEGIQALLDAYNENLAGLSDRLKATVNAGKAYSTFSGKSDAMKGSVKFIYETDAIESDD